MIKQLEIWVRLIYKDSCYENNLYPTDYKINMKHKQIIEHDSLPVVLVWVELGVLQPKLLGKQHKGIHGSLSLGLVPQLELLDPLRGGVRDAGATPVGQDEGGEVGIACRAVFKVLAMPGHAA